jgi:hypothetical protein
MRRFDSRLLWGIVLIAGGVLFLLQNLGYLPFGEYMWAAIFAIAGAVFLVEFFRSRASWWAIIPGLTLLGIGLIIILSVLFPVSTGAWVGAVFLGMIGLAFWVVYFTNRAFWWAIIPGGIMVTLAVVAAVSTFLGGFETGGLFFIGMGLTFALVGIVPTPDGQMKWAFIPAVIMLLMGVLITAAATSLINYAWPLVIIAIGVFLLLRTFVFKRS